MSSKALRTHHKLQPFINNLFLPGFKCRGRIKQEKEKNTKDEGSKETESMKRREESKTELNNQRKEEKKHQNRDTQYVQHGREGNEEGKRKQGIKENKQDKWNCEIFQVAVNCSLVNVAGNELLISKSSRLLQMIPIQLSVFHVNEHKQSVQQKRDAKERNALCHTALTVCAERGPRICK